MRSTSLSFSITYLTLPRSEPYLLADKIAKTAWIFRMNILNITNPLLVGEWLFDAVAADHSVIQPRQ